jgi:hypothetical protein
MKPCSSHKKGFFVAPLNESLQDKFVQMLGDRAALGPIEPNRIGMWGIQHTRLHQGLDRVPT